MIRSIHAIPSLFHDVTLGEVEVYLGRAGATAEHVLGRFRQHRAERSHGYGVVLFDGDTDDVISWEGTCNRLIKKLAANGSLCVANINAGENGPAPSTRQSLVYMTWRIIKRVPVSKPTSIEIEEIADSVANNAREQRTVDQLMTAMAPLTRPSTDLADIAWHPAHLD